MRIVEQVIVDKVTREAVRHLGDRPTREGFSTTVGLDGTMWFWFHRRW